MNTSDSGDNLRALALLLLLLDKDLDLDLAGEPVSRTRASKVSLLPREWSSDRSLLSTVSSPLGDEEDDDDDDDEEAPG